MYTHVAITLALDLADDAEGAMACRCISTTHMQQLRVAMRTNLLQHVVLVVLGHD